MEEETEDASGTRWKPSTDPAYDFENRFRSGGRLFCNFLMSTITRHPVVR